jgi:maltose alpha-D-glucosyltransferase / alpha-amylase
MIDLWYKNAVTYCVDVDTFMDADGNGIGDFRGLTDKLDHIEALGANCIWLLPFYPSPNRDNGYDVTDFYAVDPRLGTLGDFVEFSREAADRGLRIIVDLVCNHTSFDHPWFQSARSDPKSRYRDWYVWSKEKPENITDGVVFPGVQEAVWSYDEAAGSWYFHRFYEHQPDLNIANPAVQEEIERIMGFWLELGVSGFRVDALPFVIEGLGPKTGVDPWAYLDAFRDFLSWRRGDAILLAEANIPPEQYARYFDGGDRVQAIFNFMLNQNTFLALARGQARPIVDTLSAQPTLPIKAQWATFLRNHDELDLGRLPEAEREEVYRAFAPEPSMRLYDRGIRRRLAPMLEGNADRLVMATSLMLALPGSPVFWYGEEIGMGDDQGLEERNAVRTPMQWSAAANGGFSSADPGQLIRPALAEGPLGFEQVNVAAQRREDHSVLSRVQRLVRIRRLAREIGWGETSVVPSGHPAVLGLLSSWRGNAVLTLHNLGDRPAEAKLALKGGGHLVPILDERQDWDERDAGQPLELAPYGFRWFRVAPARN